MRGCLAVFSAKVDLFGMQIDSPENGQRLLLNVQAVAHLLSIGTRTVWRLVSAGKLPPPITIGRSKRWPRQLIEEFVNQQIEGWTA